jgi:hypothetical protein
MSLLKSALARCRRPLLLVVSLSLSRTTLKLKAFSESQRDIAITSLREAQRNIDNIMLDQRRCEETLGELTKQYEDKCKDFENLVERSHGFETG